MLLLVFLNTSWYIFSNGYKSVHIQMKWIQYYYWSLAQTYEIYTKNSWRKVLKYKMFISQCYHFRSCTLLQISSSIKSPKIRSYRHPYICRIEIDSTGVHLSYILYKGCILRRNKTHIVYVIFQNLAFSKKCILQQPHKE